MQTAPPAHPPAKAPIAERHAHLFATGVLVLGLLGVAALEFTDRPRDPLAGWYLLIWPFMAIMGDVAYVVSGVPTDAGFVRRGVLYIVGLHLLLAALQALSYVVPDPDYAAWLAERPPGEHPYGVEPWLVAVAHGVGLVFAPVIGFMLRTIRRLWVVGPEPNRDA